MVMVLDLSFSIGAAARRSGVSVHTLRYYERIGLIAGVERNSAGRRSYGADDLDWIFLLRCLRASGMTIADMKRFSDLVRSGGDIPARIDLLDRHRKQIESSLVDLKQALAVIDEKLVRYRNTQAFPSTQTTNEVPD